MNHSWPLPLIVIFPTEILQIMLVNSSVVILFLDLISNILLEMAKRGFRKGERGLEDYEINPESNLGI